MEARIATWVLRLLGIGFAVFGALFAIAPDATLATFNRWGVWFGMELELPPSGVGLWRVLAVAYMVVVTVLAFWGSVPSPAQGALLVMLVLAKASSALLALGFYFWDRPLFLYLLNCIVDGSIAVVVGVCIRWLRREAMRV